MQTGKVYQLDKHNSESYIRVIIWIFRDLKYTILCKREKTGACIPLKTIGKSTGRIPITSQVFFIIYTS